MIDEHFANAVVASVEMIARRDFMKRIYGDRYETHIAEIKQIVRSVAEKDGISVVSAALKICKQAVADGRPGVVNGVIAAAVDLCEETN